MCEAPQNAPINGVHSALLIRDQNGAIISVDIYLCPLSTSYLQEDGRRLSGIELPHGSLSYNPKKVIVGEDYRIDFFTCFIFNSIKKLARNTENPLGPALSEYQGKFIDPHIAIRPLESKEQNRETLEQIIRNVQEIANERQQKTLDAITEFANKVLR